MFIVDPSEAPDSKNLVNAIRTDFEVIEDKYLGWNIIQPLFKGIAHHFINNNE